MLDELLRRVKNWELVRPDGVFVWTNPIVKEKLSWYYRVMNNEAPAKYHILARIEIRDKNIKELPIEELWRIHDEACREFDKWWLEIRENSSENSLKIIDKELPKTSLLDVKIEIAYRTLRNCNFCERKCHINRYVKRGACLLDHRSRVSTYFHHLGEEAPLVPSGTIFFTGCNFRCVYCQNWDISQNPENGIEVNAKQLAIIQKWLRENDARNINWVGGEPTPNIHVILESIRYLTELKVNVPQLWNSNMYLTLGGMKLIMHVIDIWLPDMKYGNNKCALKYSIVRNYWEVITRNMKILAERDEDCIIRHLVLPGHVECCTKPILKWIASNYRKALVNIMDQYRPEYQVEFKREKWREIARRVTKKEMEEAYKFATELGITWEPVTK